MKCRTSGDAGVTWADEITVAAGGYPAVFVDKSKIYVAYVDKRNLFYSVSVDTGATWGEPVQINDQHGTVVPQPGTVDIGPKGFIWTDDRNGANDIYHEYLRTETPVQNPILEVKEIKGGFGVSATITNTGNASATHVGWNLTVTGGILGRIRVTRTGWAATLSVGAEMRGTTEMFLGFGPISVEVTVACDEGSTATFSKTGTQLLIFTRI